MCPSNAAMPQGTTTPPPSATKSEHSHGGAEASTKPQAENSRAAATLRTRKRTKTGCLTCRRRRIKCGEERPVCNNCIKSKRSCEGYARPLTFRDPLAISSTWGPRGMHRLESHAHLQPQIHSAGPRPYMTPQSASATQSHFPIIAPRPTQPELTGAYMHGHEHMMWPQTPPHAQVVYYSPSASDLAGPASAPISAGFAFSQPPPQSPMTAMPTENQMHAPRPSMTWPGVSGPEEIPTQQAAMTTGAVLASTPAYAQELYRYDGVRSAPPLPLEEQQQHAPAYTTASMSPVMMAPSTDPLPSTGFEVATTYASAAASPQEYYGPVDAEDSVPVPTGTAAQLPRHDYGLMLALAASREDQAIRSYDAFLEKPDILATYVPNYSASPLMDNTTARIFCHFITATAPFLSIFERHPVSPYVVFSGREIPRAQQAVWTYILPMMALSNQTLLQTMLALASLQIARLQNSPHTASMRHYHYALRKVAKSVSSPSKRTTIPTLAATLLLGHYEATTAEHSKWSSHLAGAKQLFMEVDFIRPARQIRQLRAQESTEPWTSAYVSAQLQAPSSNLPWVPAANSADEQVVTQLAGASSPSESSGILSDDTTAGAPLTEKDIEDFQIYRDLFWFYVKQDIIQSCISGNPLLLPYERWMHCPPRGPINKIDMAYGTMDHMLLLMGRVCHFAHQDQARKARSETAQAGSSENTSYGLIPGVFPTTMPDVFKNSGYDQGHAAPSVESTSNDEFAAAEAEWNSIQSAFTLFEQSLGSAFAQLPSDAAPSAANTPFGAAIHYRTQQIATIWSFYYTARIISMRTHPSMPASPTAAAELVASQTGSWSTAIARIALGLQPPPTNQPLNPSFGAALSESMLPLFFAGVEYKDTAQRTTTIERLRLIAERAGLESAMLVAHGLEQQWEQQAERGAGPPYTRTVHESASGVLGHVDGTSSAAFDAAMMQHSLSSDGGAFMTSSAPPQSHLQSTSTAVYVPNPNPTPLDELELGNGAKSWGKGLLGDEDPTQLGMAPMF